MKTNTLHGVKKIKNNLGLGNHAGLILQPVRSFARHANI